MLRQIKANAFIFAGRAQAGHPFEEKRTERMSVTFHG